MHDHAAQGKGGGLHVVCVHTVVAYLGIGEGHYLARIARVTYDLLVPRHGGVEDYLAESLALSPTAATLQGRAVLERE